MPSNNASDTSHANGLFDNSTTGWWVTFWIVTGVVAVVAVFVVVGLIKSYRKRIQGEKLVRQVKAHAEHEPLRDALRTVFVEAGTPESGLPIEDDPVDDDPMADVDDIDPYVADAAAVVVALHPAYSDGPGDFIDRQGSRTHACTEQECGYTNDASDAAWRFLNPEREPMEDARVLSRPAQRALGIAVPFETIVSDTGTYRVADVEHQVRRDGVDPFERQAEDEQPVLFDQVSALYGEPVERVDLSFTGAWRMVPAPSAAAAPTPSRPAQLAIAGRPPRNKGGRKGGRR